MDAKINGGGPAATGLRPRPDGRGAPSPGIPLAARLDAVGARIPPPQIADVWLFPPLPDVVSSSEFVLFTRILEGDTRAVFSARVVPANGSPAHQVIIEHGRAPADRVARLVANLQRRLGQTAAPKHVRIEGEAERWCALLEAARESARGAPAV